MDFKASMHRFTVVPSLSPELAGLQRVAANLWWSWEPTARLLFRRLDPELWETTGHNPVEMLGILQQANLDNLVTDDGFMAHLARVEERLDAYLGANTWFARHHPNLKELRIAYFSMEYGLHESLPIYSGGLGVLSGDHLKTASDLGLPLVGIGLLYRQGYFRQYLNSEGWQQEIYPENDFYNLPLKLERDVAGQPLRLELELPGRKLYYQVWRVQVGRVPLLLLDSNLAENLPEDREITAQLYNGDRDMRIRQEMLLGMGGLKALHALNLAPNVCHMNEGHAAFLAVEWLRMLIEEQGASFAEAREAVRAGTIFTTHTPVEAGIDHFAPELVDRYFGRFYRLLGISRDAFLGMGRHHPKNQQEPFCMAVLALRLSGHANGVSQLHGEVSRGMWRGLWEDLPEEHLPLFAVTNGVHPRTWLSREMAELFVRYLGTRWLEDAADRQSWRRVARIPDTELWRIHERCRERLVVFARERLKNQLTHVGATAKEIAVADEVLDPEVLTIGFARRFATYKRGTLLLRDVERLARILNHPERPVQIVFAGKAHPQDHEGKELIREIVQLSKEERFRHRIVFIEDYEMGVARALVQGVDVWLNTPRRPLEASGTSGMKVAFNGGLNLSVLDGWWCEGYKGDNGWAIGKGEVYDDLEYQNEVEGRAIYDLLEKEIVPLFYDRGADGIPRGWLATMKASLASLCPFFSTDRMVQEYTARCYVPAFEQWQRLTGDNLALARDLARWKGEVADCWPQVRIEQVTAEFPAEVSIGSRVPVTVRVATGGLPVEQLNVALYYGLLGSRGQIVGGELLPLELQEGGAGTALFAGELECRFAGRHGFLVRVMPAHPEVGGVYEPGCLTWG